MKTIAALTVAAGLALSAQGAFAQQACSAPTLPPRPGLEVSALPPKPERPACADKGNCSKDAAAKYNAANTAYNDAVTARNVQVEAANTYLKALDQFGQEMNTYMKCERDSLATKLAVPAS